jgi:hypothetical protein
MASGYVYNLLCGGFQLSSLREWNAAQISFRLLPRKKEGKNDAS